MARVFARASPFSLSVVRKSLAGDAEIEDRADAGDVLVDELRVFERACGVLAEARTWAPGD